ncbi:MAG TPA: glucokinase, partial [Burkholderiales bacterium]|nr:glucokinase [Burkholderiales bacterium]
MLVADIGATNVRFAIARRERDRARLDFTRAYAAREFADCAAAGSAFMTQMRAQVPGVELSQAVIAAAGPVRGNAARLTNRPSWTVSGAALEGSLGVQTTVCNDLQALARGVAQAQAEDWIELQPGAPEPRAPLAVIAAGTGLGVAALVWAGGSYHALASEAGHIGFAPQSARALGLARALLAEHGRASAERVVCGPGLAAIYRFLAGDATPAADPAAIAAQALAEPASSAARALDLFIACYGAFAGDVALAFLARGG